MSPPLASSVFSCMRSENPRRSREVLFVCAHGIVRSRVAAAFFNLVAPPGWWATSAGLEPESQLGETARSLLAGTKASRFLETGPPRSLEDSPSSDVLVAIDCEVPGAEQWRLTTQEIGRAMAEELRTRSATLAALLSEPARDPGQG